MPEPPTMVTLPEPATSVVLPEPAISESLPPLPTSESLALLPVTTSLNGVPMTPSKRPISERVMYGVTCCGVSAWLEPKEVMLRLSVMALAMPGKAMVLIPWVWPSICSRF